jgi:hypothetical protein
MIVPPIEERLSLSLSFFITFEDRGNTLCLCSVFRVTLYFKKKGGRWGMEGDYSELVQVCISNMACNRCIPPGVV